MPSFEANGIAPGCRVLEFRTRLPRIEEKRGNGATSATIISEWKFTGIL